MVGTKTHDYSNFGRLSEYGYSGLFLSTRPSPNVYTKCSKCNTFQAKSNLVYDFVNCNAFKDS